MLNFLNYLKYTKYFIGILYKNWLSYKESYAQHGEDILVEKLLGKVNSFIDIGANDGVLFSNTYKFAKQGACGLCIEPSRVTFLKLICNHLPHIRVKCLRTAISNKEGSLHFQDSGYESVLSKVCEEHNSKTYKVKSNNLQNLLKTYPRFRQTDLISIDVEGHEKNVITGAGLDPLDAKIIIIEIDKTNLNEILKQPVLKDFEPVYTNGVNIILLNKNHHFSPIIKLPAGYYSYKNN